MIVAWFFKDLIQILENLQSIPLCLNVDPYIIQKRFY